MKMISKIVIVFLMLFSVITVFAAPEPPNPSTAKTAQTTAVDPFPETDIDDNLMVLMFFGLSLGVFAIYKHKLKTKASV